MPISFTIKRSRVCTLILVVLIALMCLGCNGEEELESSVKGSTEPKPTSSSVVG